MPPACGPRFEAAQKRCARSRPRRFRPRCPLTAAPPPRGQPPLAASPDRSLLATRRPARARAASDHFKARWQRAGAPTPRPSSTQRLREQLTVVPAQRGGPRGAGPQQPRARPLDRQNGAQACSRRGRHGDIAHSQAAAVQHAVRGGRAGVGAGAGAAAAPQRSARRSRGAGTEGSLLIRPAPSSPRATMARGHRATACHWAVLQPPPALDAIALPEPPPPPPPATGGSRNQLAPPHAPTPHLPRPSSHPRRGGPDAAGALRACDVCLESASDAGAIRLGECARWR